MRDEMRRGGDILAGLLLGAGAMYLLDPDRGTRRRALMRDRAIHLGHTLERLGLRTAGRGRDLRNRARGAVAEARGRLGSAPVDDDILKARVRARLGHLLGRRRGVEVSAQGGCVSLAGDVAEPEATRLLDAVSAVPGVRDVVDRFRAGSVSPPTND